MPCPDPNLIAELAAGALAGEERASVEHHLDGCEPCRQVVAELQRELAPGAAVGRYRVLQKIGAGAMGSVYAAYDPELDRTVALKLLHAAGGQERLVAEGRAMARLAHPNVVPVLDLGTSSDGRVFVAMELVDGITLRQWLAAERRSWRAIVAALVEAGRGLAAAHREGITHRDFKPENLLIGADGRTRVTDFGLARSSPTAGPPGAGVDLSRSGGWWGRRCTWRPSSCARGRPRRRPISSLFASSCGRRFTACGRSTTGR
jgi:serine/threonine protein kinase